MEEKILDQLLKDAYTLEEFRKKYQEFKRLAEARLYESESGVKNQKSEEGGGVKDGEKSGELEDLAGQLKSGDFVRVSEYIEDFMRTHEALAIYFVFMPEKEQIREIGNWLRTNLKNPRQIFQIKVDPALIGGCAIAYKGVYKDYSLRSKIGESKSKLIEEFRKYFHQ